MEFDCITTTFEKIDEKTLQLKYGSQTPEYSKNNKIIQKILYNNKYKLIFTENSP
jgi:hypothetical protein